MSDHVKYIFTCVFTNERGHLFGVRYLLAVPNEVLAQDIDTMENAKRYFLSEYKQVIGKDFDGNILFIEETDLSILL